MIGFLRKTDGSRLTPGAGLLAIALALRAGLAPADDFDDAERTNSAFHQTADGITTTIVATQKRLVEAICSVDDAERRNVATDASARVKNQVVEEYGKASRLHDQFNREVDKVLSNEQLKDKQSTATDMRRRLNERWERIEQRSRVYRESENPVAMQILQIGNEAHREYQHNSSNCSESEWQVTSDGRADCINSARCEVIELKPNNSRAIRKGRDQAAAYAEVLNLSDDEFNKLSDRNSNFKKCKGQFKPRVACYTYCPEIDDEGNVRSTSVGWSMCD